MAIDFEALVGHLYVVGGRSISTTPPGALVEVAPKKAARGRETETFFVMILPSGDVTAPTAFYEQMARLSTEMYFSTSGSVTAALRSVFNSLNENLVEHNYGGRRQYEANMLCAVLRGNDLIVGRVGAGIALIRLAGETRTFPENLSDDEALFGPPLGVKPIPDVRMTRYTVSNGTRLVLADSNLAEVQVEKMTNALLAQDIGEALASFKPLVAKQSTLMVVEFVPPETPAPPPVRVGTSTAEIAALKTAAGEVESAAVNGQAETAPRSSRRRHLSRSGSAVQTQVQRQAGSAALRLAGVLTFFDRLLDHFFPEPDDSKRKLLSTPLATGMVVLVPVAVVLVVVAIWLGGVGPSEFEVCLNEANSRAELARSIPSNNRTQTLDAWTLVLAQIDTCSAMRQGDVSLASLRAEGQAIVDRLSSVERRDAALIAAVQKASLKSIVLRGTDLYVLDSANSQVYRITLAADGRSSASAPAPIPSMRKGATINQFAVGDIIDIAFAQQANIIVALDRNGLLITCSPRFITTCEAQRLLAAETWADPVSLAIWQGRLYVLDPGANQIWKYEPSGGVYASSPTEYFTGQGRPNIGSSVDFGIDDKGNVYILRVDGVLNQFFGGEVQNFGYAGFPEPPAAANALFINNSPILPSLMVADRANRTIYDMSMAGTFNASYRVSDENQLALLSDIAADPSQPLIYAASGNSVFVIEK